MCRTTAFASLAFSPCLGHDLALGARAAALRHSPFLHLGLKLAFNPRTIEAKQFVPSNIVLGNNEWVFAAPTSAANKARSAPREPRRVLALCAVNRGASPSEGVFCLNTFYRSFCKSAAYN